MLRNLKSFKGYDGLIAANCLTVNTEIEAKEKKQEITR